MPPMRERTYSQIVSYIRDYALGVEVRETRRTPVRPLRHPRQEDTYLRPVPDAEDSASLRQKRQRLLEDTQTGPKPCDKETLGG